MNATSRPVRNVLVYLDVAYRRDHSGYSSDRAFIKLMLALESHFEDVSLVGRVRPGRSDYSIPPSIRVIALPDYPSLRDVPAVLGALPRALRVLWRAVHDADAVVSIGPHPLSLPTALFAWLQRKELTLMVRQNYPEYIRHRLPSARWRPFVLVAKLADASFRLASRSNRTRVVVVGDELARLHGRARHLLDLTVSLMPANEHATHRGGSLPGPDGALRLLAVTRLDPEKTPELLVEAAALIGRRHPSWNVTLTIVGDGPLRDRVARAAEDLSVALTFAGYLPHGDALFDVYRDHDILVHSAKTEGVPQVIVEALSIGLPVVATDVGGVRALVADGAAAALVPPGDAASIADAVAQIVLDDSLRRARVARGLEETADLTIESQASTLAGFVAHTRAP